VSFDRFSMSGGSRKATVISRYDKQQAQKRAMEKFFAIQRASGLQKGLQQLMSLGYLKNTANDIADFMLAHISKLDMEAVGEYLGGKR